MFYSFLTEESYWRILLKNLTEESYLYWLFSLLFLIFISLKTDLVKEEDELMQLSDENEAFELSELNDFSELDYITQTEKNRISTICRWEDIIFDIIDS